MGAGIAPRVLTRRAGRVGLPHRGRRHGPHRPAPRARRAGRRRRRRGAAAVLLPHGRAAPLVPLRARRRSWSTSGRSTRGSACSRPLPRLQQRRRLEPGLLGRGALPPERPQLGVQLRHPRVVGRVLGQQLVQLRLAGVQAAELALQPVGVLARLAQQRCRGPAVVARGGPVRRRRGRPPARRGAARRTARCRRAGARCGRRRGAP